MPSLVPSSIAIPHTRALAQRALVVARALPSFSWQVLKAFRANQGLLLAGAVAYYTLLSLVPLLILVLIALSHVIDQARLLVTLGEYLEFLVPGQGEPILAQLVVVLAHREVVGGFLLVTMLFFSATAFTVLENAMSVVFLHRVAVRRRHFLVSAILPYAFIVLLSLGLLLATIVSGKLAVLATREIAIFGVPRSLDAVSTYLLYLMGVAGEILVVTSIYLVMPVGRISWRHALLGGVVACVLWELMRHALVWYYETLSQIQVVYGSFATAVAVLLSVEIAALLLLLGAQVIANYEQLKRGPVDAAAPAQPMRTEAVPAVALPATE